MNTTGRWSGGIEPALACAAERRPRMPTILSIAEVAPEPQNTTTVSSSPPTASRTIRRASSRSTVVCRPVPLDSVWVLAYAGSTRSRMKSSMNDNERPLAV
jgi:hypothetical protein